ncbi:MAG TPA: hypothetical protein VFT10_05050 [Solirubrobacterales bacterium]|nr:hypothetical protein [Solirubrobacterales bacterium]
MPSVRKLATVTAMLALALTAPSASASGNGGVLVVGDSLADLTSPYLEKYLPGVPLTVNAVAGYNSFQIFDLFQESYDPSQSVIVFDAGTNDNPAYPEILAGNLEKVEATVGDRCMVVPTMHGFTVDGIDNTGKNQVVVAFAGSRPGTQVPDWARAEETHPELMQADDLHPTAAGADLRARLIARGVKACLGIATAAERKPALESGPNLPPARKMARRQAAMVDRVIAAVMALFPIPLADDA